MNRKRIIIGGLVLVAAIAITVLTIAGAWASPPAVKTATVERRTLSVTVTVPGKTVADRKADVFPPTTGTLARVLVEEGQSVRAGQTLAVLDTEKLDAQVDRAEAAYDAAGAQMDSLDAQGASKAERAAASEQVAVARKALWAAESDVKSARAAGKGPGAARLAAAEMRRDQAHAALTAAQAQRARLDQDPLDGQRHGASAARRQAAVDLKLARRDRDRASLRAPIDGVVRFNPTAAAPGATPVGPSAGCPVSPAAAPFTVVRLDSVRFEAQADESDIPGIRQNAKAAVTLDAFPDRECPTSVITIATTAVSTASGGTAFPVTMRLSGKGLRIGMAGNAVVEVTSVADALVVPLDAVQESGGRSYVYLAKGGQLARRSVKTGASTDTDVQIVSGLKLGEAVAIGSAETLKDGMAVKKENAR